MNKQTQTPQIKKLSKVIVIGNDQYLLPLNQNGYYVSDANGKTILECRSVEIAKEMLKLLNTQ